MTHVLKLGQAYACANCDRAIDSHEQKFCPACGQPTPAHRIDWQFLGHELEHSILHMDRGIFFSLKNLMLRPGHFIRDYIEGRRAHHVKPLLLIMILAAMMVFLAKYFLDGNVMSSGMAVGATPPAGAKLDGRGDATQVVAAAGVLKEWMNRNYALATLLLLPMEAAAFRLAFHRVGELNYPEWLVITTFLTAQTFVIVALVVPLGYWFPQVRGWAVPLALVYSVFTLVQYFKGYPRWKSLLRSAFGFGLYMLANAAFSFVVAAVLLAFSGRH